MTVYIIRAGGNVRRFRMLIFGLMVPFLSWIIGFLFTDISISLSGLWEMHIASPVYFIVDLTPIILGGVGWLVWWRLSSKQYFIKIPLYRLVGNIPTRVATYRARKFRIGKAGDFLWYVKGIKKFLPPATIQTAPNEYMHWEREDGEWINFAMGFRKCCVKLPALRPFL